jgi:hypothetical protein
VSVETPSVDEATDIIAKDDLSSPVFVDASGRRGKRIRIVFGALGAATLVYGALVATSLAGGPLKPQQLLPFPELVNNLPVLDQGQPATQPGAKSTAAAKQAAVATAKKINPSNRPAQSGPIAVPTGSAAATPGATATATPPAEATDAPPTIQPSTRPSASPTPTKSAEPTKGPTGTPTPTATEGTATALPVETGGSGQTPGTVPVNDDAAGLPGATPVATSSGGSDGGSGGTNANPSATASLGPA